MTDHFDDLFAWADKAVEAGPKERAMAGQMDDLAPADAQGDNDQSPTSTEPTQRVSAGASFGPCITANTAAEALAALNRVDRLSDATLSDIRSAVKAIAKATQRDPRHISLAPIELVPLLRSIHPARQGFSAKRWSNIRTAIRTIGILAGHVVDERSLPLDEAGHWARVLEAVALSPKRSCLRRFARYCVRRGFSPAEVDAVVLSSFRKWLHEYTYEMNAKALTATVRQVWNSAVVPLGGEGVKQLPHLGDPRRVSLTIEELPPQLAADIVAYGAARRALDPFSGPAVKRSTEATIQDREKRLVYAASLLIRIGAPADRISCLRALVTRENLVAVLRHMMSVSSASEPRMHHMHTALAFLDAAKTYLQLSEDQLRPLQDVRARIKPPKPGLSSRAAHRLVPFDDERLRARLLALPDKLFTAAELQRKGGQLGKAAYTHERALALAILLVQPLRRRALAAIDMDAHLQRNASGLITRLCLPGTVVKNGVAVDAPIQQALARRIDRHVRVFRPTLPGAEISRQLFPAPDGRARTPDAIAAGVKKAVKQELGVEFSVGLIRHFVATLLYEASPQAGPIAQRLLGHTSVKTTELMYGQLTTRSAHDTWAKIVEKQRRRSGPSGGRR